MIIVQLNGGLGNQLFQYATGRKLAIRNNTELKLDLTLLEDLPHEVFSLKHFNINADILEKKEANKFYKKNIISRIIRKSKALTRTGKNKYIKEKEWYIFDPDILKLPDNTYLSGYWQSEKYFFDIEETIKQELCLDISLSQKSCEAEETIKSLNNTVSLHIRRGDYITNPKVFDYFGVCSLDYYNNCINKLNKIIGNLNIFVFSDDPSWAKNNLETSNKLFFIEHNNNLNAYEDLYLMSICENNITANSSFSWWGAWLNKNKDKYIFAPKYWVIKEKNKKLDIVPNSWNRV
ncbi:MAG: alpha-1,2-fucosyltransferase [Treponema sp.]|nr:alpha-1,2-fucosyltransferase [Treponema sp.]